MAFSFFFGTRMDYDVLERVLDRLLRSSARRDRRRIEHLEDEDYLCDLVTARLADDRTDERWDLEAWADEHKVRYLERCRAWMDCPG